MSCQHAGAPDGPFQAQPCRPHDLLVKGGFRKTRPTRADGEADQVGGPAPGWMVRLNAQRAGEEARYQRCCRGRSASTGQDSRQRGRLCGHGSRTPCGERLGYASAGPQSQRGGSRTVGVVGGWEDERRQRTPPASLALRTGQAFSRLLLLQAGRPCAAPKPRNLGEAASVCCQPLRGSERAHPVPVPGERLCPGTGEADPDGGVSEVPFPLPPPCRVHAFVLSLAAAVSLE